MLFLLFLRPILLMSAEIPNARMIFNIVFFVTIVSLLVQGTTVSAMARWLGLVGKSEEKEIFNVALPDEIKSAMSEIELTDEALSGGNKLMNLHCRIIRWSLWSSAENNILFPKDILIYRVETVFW